MVPLVLTLIRFSCDVTQDGRRVNAFTKLKLVFVSGGVRASCKHP